MAGVMYRERTLILPKNVDQMIEALYTKRQKHGYGTFSSSNDFWLYLVDLGAKKFEYDMNKFIAPSIVIPGAQTTRPQ